MVAGVRLTGHAQKLPFQFDLFVRFITRFSPVHEQPQSSVQHHNFWILHFNFEPEVNGSDVWNEIEILFNAEQKFLEETQNILSTRSGTSFFVSSWLAGQTQTPSPNEYHVEKIHPLEEPNAPAYSMGLRTRYWECSPSPAPNSYTLPGTLGPRSPITTSAPCVSMASSASVWGYATDPVKGPGPAKYTVPDPDVYLHHQPSHSISQKFKPSSKDNFPGPPDYSVELVTVHKPKAPRFSLGIRHSDYICSTPTLCLIKEWIHMVPCNMGSYFFFAVSHLPKPTWRQFEAHIFT